MDKENQIEELGNDIKESLLLHIHKTILYPYIAQDLNNKGYRKINDNEVVIRKEQYKELTLAKQSIFKLIDEREDKTRKETAKKILTFIGNMYDECDSRFKLKDYQWHKDLCKQYGVEIGE